ncbi:MAG: hypothetical protein KGJ08_07410 [Gammaproteobacteria bacterium]|nr:hypothetical protein [Gammaproteobacteria bacterium]
MSAQFREILLYRQAIMAGLQTWNVNTGDYSDVFMQQEYMFLVFPKCMNFIMDFYARSRMEYKPATIEALGAHMASLGFLYGWMSVSGSQKYEWRVYPEQCHHEYGFPAWCMNRAGLRFDSKPIRFEAREGKGCRKLDNPRFWALGPSALKRIHDSVHGDSVAEPFTWP